VTKENKREESFDKRESMIEKEKCLDSVQNLQSSKDFKNKYKKIKIPLDFRKESV